MWSSDLTATQLCRVFLKRQIEQYLTRHADLPPKCIILIGVLVPHATTARPSTAPDTEPRQSTNGSQPHTASDADTWSATSSATADDCESVSGAQSDPAANNSTLELSLSQRETQAALASEGQEAGQASSANQRTEEQSSTTSEQQAELGQLPGYNVQRACLVGTVELSFSQSTRSRYLTLNAPQVSHTSCMHLDSH